MYRLTEVIDEIYKMPRTINILPERKAEVNLLPSNCITCGVDLMVNQRCWGDLAAHKCPLHGHLPKSDENLPPTPPPPPSIISNIITFDSEVDELEEFEDLDLIDNEFANMPIPKIKVKKCECGADKAKTAGHSSWCPIYDAKTKGGMFK